MALAIAETGAQSVKRRTFTSLNGTSIELETFLEPGQESCNAGIELRTLGIKYHHLASGPRNFARHYALSPRISEGMQLDQEFSYQGGTLWLGSGNQLVGADGARYGSPDSGGQPGPGRIDVAVWEGNAHSLLTFRYGSGERFDLLAVLNHFHLEETPFGITAFPRSESGAFYISGPKLAVDIPGFGLLDIRELISEEARELPRGSGTRVRGGELFVSHPNDHHSYLVLVGSSTVTYILPHDVSEDELIAGAQGLSISVRPLT